MDAPGTAGRAVIEIRDLDVRLGGTPVLLGLTVTIDPGALVCIVGPNGAGKTTLLRTLAGETAPSAGRISVDGRTPADLTIPDRARLRAYLAHSERSDIPYPARTVVGFGTHLSTLDGPGQTAMVDRALEDMEIADIADRRVASLSGGERRRVAIARTLAQDAHIVVLDEPTDSLDLGHADVVLAHLARLAAGGRTIVVSSHDLNLAARHADRILVMSRGRIVADGAASEVLVPELLSDVYRCEVRVMRHPDDGSPIIFL